MTDTASDSPRRPGPGRTSTRRVGSGDERDRDQLGRPDNARPRDRTGRPLPRDTSETELVEELDYDTVEEALDWGVRRWRQGRFFEAHECFEDVWHWSVGPDQQFWQGVIQVAVAHAHHQRGNPGGVVATCHKALGKLEGQPATHHGIDVEGLRAWCRTAAALQAEHPGAALDPPELGLGPDGATLDAPGPATPLARRGDAHRGNTDDGADEADATGTDGPAATGR